MSFGILSMDCRNFSDSMVPFALSRCSASRSSSSASSSGPSLPRSAEAEVGGRAQDARTEPVGVP